ncbi:MAG TPA: SUMF1/EgtB/PvdO family nonheme iron enzyme [Vicinamibacterales bacterium]|nr:SUMF1/EgtB/PvdO family nonheme iron enzyme [Vicinamibacterales bacterium]
MPATTLRVSRRSPLPSRRGPGVGALPVAVATLCAAAGLLAQSGGAPTGYRESIPGTLVTFEMALVPGGTVVVDSATLTVEPFHIGRTEVTWDMYDVFALGLDKPKARGGSDAIARPSEPYGAPDRGWGHAGYPAISIARGGAEAFCAWLSAVTGKAYRLPTEAEWLHAARLAADGADLTADGRNALAWHRGNSSGKTHPVGTRAADALGLFDLFGNAAEWIATSDGAPVVRGGSFGDPAAAVGPEARAAQGESWNERDPQLPKSRWWLSDAPFVGFRVVSSGGSGGKGTGGSFRRTLE